MKFGFSSYFTDVGSVTHGKPGSSSHLHLKTEMVSIGEVILKCLWWSSGGKSASWQQGDVIRLS